jgi:uncharacterized protein YjdB
MTDARLNSNGNVSLWWVPTNGFVNWKSPKASEINAGVFLGDAISWNDYGFGTQASDTTNDPPVSAKGKVQVRGAGKYGGNLSFYYPGAFGDDTNEFSTVFDLFRVPGLTGYLVIRIDGEVDDTDAGTAAFPGLEANAGDLVHVYKVTTDAQSDVITGDGVRFRYTYTFLSQGQLAVYTVVGGVSAPTVAITPLTFTAAVGDAVVLNAKVGGRNYTRGVKWISSDPTKATVSKNGVVTAIAAGSVSISCVYQNANVTSTAPSVGTIS